MRIGIFDSGLGGLFLAKAIIKRLPKYDYLYLGDNKRLPYGNRSQETVYEFTRECVDFLFKNDCQLVILACNTASAEALRKLQQEWLPKHYSDRRILGVIVPALEALTSQEKAERIGVLATQSTIDSHVYDQELKKLIPSARIVEQAAPLLVPLIEFGGMQWMEPILWSYLKPLVDAGVDTIVLGCTHYAILKEIIARLVGPNIRVLSQDDVVPNRLASYLVRHPEIESILSKKSERTFLVTDSTPHFEKLAREWFGDSIKLAMTSIDSNN